MRSEVVINYALEAKETRGKKTCPGYHGMHVTSLLNIYSACIYLVGPWIVVEIGIAEPN